MPLGEKIEKPEEDPTQRKQKPSGSPGFQFYLYIWFHHNYWSQVSTSYRTAPQPALPPFPLVDGLARRRMAVVSAACPSAVYYVATLRSGAGFQISKNRAYQHRFGCGSCLLIVFPAYQGLSYHLLHRPVVQRALAVPPSGRDGSPGLRYILRWAWVSL